MNRIIDYFQYLSMMEDWIGLMPWAEVEDFPASAMKAAAAAEYFAALEPTHKDQVVWFGNVKMLPVHFSMRNFDVFANTFHNGMSW